MTEFRPSIDLGIQWMRLGAFDRAEFLGDCSFLKLSHQMLAENSVDRQSQARNSEELKSITVGEKEGCRCETGETKCDTGCRDSHLLLPDRKGFSSDSPQQTEARD